MKLKVV